MEVIIYHTHVLYSEKFDQIYIGHTDDLKRRLIRHNAGLVRSTKRYLPWKLLYYEPFESRSQAIRREKQLKSHKGREFIRNKLLKD